MECAWTVGRTRRPSSRGLAAVIQYDSGEEVEDRGFMVARSACGSSAATQGGIADDGGRAQVPLDLRSLVGQPVHPWRSFLRCLFLKSLTG